MGLGLLGHYPHPSTDFFASVGGGYLLSLGAPSAALG